MNRKFSMASSHRDEITRKTMSSTPYRLIPLYGDLIKVKQTLLLVFSGVFAWLISTWPHTEFHPFFWIMISLFLAVSGSTLLNMYIDRDIDAIMKRTSHRALPSGRLSPSSVLFFGSILSLTGVTLAGLHINTVTMVMIFLGLFFDVVIYSLLLKRRTRFSIIFGGISGGLPAMAGRTAVTGSVDATALLLGLFVLCWIPMHILTLAMVPENRENYRRAGVPMWPVVRSLEETVRVITLSAVLSTVVLVLIVQAMGFDHLIMSPVYCMGVVMVYIAARNFNRPNMKRIFLLFKVASLFMAFSFLWLFVVKVFG